MAESDFDDLLKRLPSIAKAVNAFTSEAVQQQAFEALVSTLQGVKTKGTSNGGSDEGKAGRSGGRRRKRQPVADGGHPEPKATPRQPRAASPSLDRNLVLRPKRGQSFKEFATSKGPTTAQEKNVVAVQWLQAAGVDAIGQDQVYTCYKEMGWRRPADLYNSLAVTASKKGWLNTGDMNHITVSPRGENLVDHDLPRKKKE